MTYPVAWTSRLGIKKLQYLGKKRFFFTSRKIFTMLFIKTLDRDPELDPGQDTIKSGNFS
jgi:hypothetical protein